MIRFFINQKRNNIFISILNEFNKKIYYKSIGLMGEQKIINFSLIELLLLDMLNFFESYIYKNYIIFKKNLYCISKKKKKYFKIFFFFHIFDKYEDFLIPIFDFFFKLDLKFNFIFLNKFAHGGCKFKKKNIKLKKKKVYK